MLVLMAPSAPLLSLFSAPVGVSPSVTCAVVCADCTLLTLACTRTSEDCMVASRPPLDT